MVISIIEAKYMTITEASKEIVKELGIGQGGVHLHCDS